MVASDRYVYKIHREDSCTYIRYLQIFQSAYIEYLQHISVLSESLKQSNSQRGQNVWKNMIILSQVVKKKELKGKAQQPRDNTK